MRITKSRSLEAKRGGINRVVLGVMAMASVALVGLAPAGVAYATGPGGTMPTSKEQCKKGGWRSYGFKNQGECVSWVTRNNNGGGYGGNGNGSPDIDIDLDLNHSNNNVINIIIRWVVGG